MEDYPKTLTELEQRFSTEEACREYLFQLRWAEGFRCPVCGHNDAWKLKGGLFKCTSCTHKTSVIAGTLFEGTRKPLVDDEPKERSKCIGIAAHFWTGKL